VTCAPLSGQYVENIETRDARFFPETEIPELSEMRNTPAQIQMCFRHMRGEETSVEFD
jgi:hypothetical protein